MTQQRQWVKSLLRKFCWKSWNGQGILLESEAVRLWGMWSLVSPIPVPCPMSQEVVTVLLNHVLK